MSSGQLVSPQTVAASASNASKTPRLLDQARAVLRLHHYAIRTERAYLDWVRRYVKFHEMSC